MKINVAVDVKPFPVPTELATTDESGPPVALTQIDRITLAQLCREFTDSVFEAAGVEPIPYKRTRGVIKPAPATAPVAAPVAGKASAVAVAGKASAAGK